MEYERRGGLFEILRCANEALVKNLDISTKLKHTWFSNIKELYIADVLLNEERVNMVTINRG
jgi:hypothetical protein